MSSSIIIYVFLSYNLYQEAHPAGQPGTAGYCDLFGTDAATIDTCIAMVVIFKATPLSDVECSRGITMTFRTLDSPGGSIIASYQP
ncbi:MAG: hypothetical protein MIO93_12210 [ANME-2 cluster archaeon]|jgi:hypothetical protein|nr:hypothetical protein [ANME-2 cluster archaeon]